MEFKISALMSHFEFEVKRTMTGTTLALIPVLAVLLGSPVRAAAAKIAGQVTHGATHRPVASQKVEVLSPQGGMSIVGETTTDSRGRFVFDNSQLDAGGFYLLQATYEGVDYHAPVKFDSNGNSVVDIAVYESTRKEPGIQVGSARLIVRAEGSQAHVQELFALDNPLQQTYNNPKGTFSFHISPQAGNPTVAVAGLMNMPLPQTPQRGEAPGDYSISYALKPGLTVVMVAYDVDYEGEKLILADSIPYPIARVELFVSPASLTVASKLFRPAGEDAETGSRIYEADRLAQNTPFAAQVAGQAAPAAAPAEANVNQEQQQIKSLPDSVAAVGVPLLLCFLLVLLWALGIRAAKEWPRWKARQKGSPVQKQFRAKLDALLNSIADLDELFASGKIAEKQYWKERLELKAKAVAILQEGPSAKSKPHAARTARH